MTGDLESAGPGVIFLFEDQFDKLVSGFDLASDIYTTWDIISKRNETCAYHPGLPLFASIAGVGNFETEGLVTKNITNSTMRLNVDLEDGQFGIGPNEVPMFDIIGDNHISNKSLVSQGAIDAPNMVPCDMEDFVISSSVFTGIGGAIDIYLSYSIIAKGKTNPGVDIMYYVTLGRFILEDVPQLIITYYFLKSGQGDLANAWSMFFSLISLAQMARGVIYDRTQKEHEAED